MASENSDRAQPKCSATGIWKTPKLARMPKLTRRIDASRNQNGRQGEDLGFGIVQLRYGPGKDVTDLSPASKDFS